MPTAPAMGKAVIMGAAPSGSPVWTAEVAASEALEARSEALEASSEAREAALEAADEAASPTEEL